MKKTIRYALLAGAAVVAAIGAGAATMQAPPKAGSPQYHAQGRGHGRGPGRFFAEYDLNHDGKVTHDEVNKVVAQRFTQATGSGKAMSQQQLAEARSRTAQQHVLDSFRRSDWNGDGKLSFDEYANPIRARFARADRQTAGFIVCHPPGSPAAQTGGRAATTGRRGGSHGSRGAAGFCPRDDLNHDGKVTRAELDKALTQQFSAAAKGGASLSREQFVAMEETRSKSTSGHMFQRLDQNHDGTLTLAEFGASQQKMFARLDKNNDGVITRDELAASRTRGGYGKPPARN